MNCTPNHKKYKIGDLVISYSPLNPNVEKKLLRVKSYTSDGKYVCEPLEDALFQPYSGTKVYTIEELCLHPIIDMDYLKKSMKSLINSYINRITRLS